MLHEWYAPSTNERGAWVGDMSIISFFRINVSESQEIGIFDWSELEAGSKQSLLLLQYVQIRHDRNVL